MLTAVPDNKDNPEAATTVDILQAAVARHRAGDFALAESLYRRAQQGDPRNPIVLGLFGALAIQTGRLQMAVDLLQSAIAEDPRVSDYHNNLAEAYRGLGRFDVAIAHYRTALTLSPRDAEARINLGNALQQAGQVETAIAEFRQVIAERPDLPEAHNNLGNALHALARHEEAAENLSRAVALRPDYIEAHHNLAIVRIDQGRADEAASGARNVLSFVPDHAGAHNTLAEALLAGGDLDGAEASARRATTCAPDRAEGHATLGRVLSARLNWAEAALALERALTLRPDLAAVKVDLGRALLEQGKAEAAVRVLEAAVHAHPKLAEAHYYLGNAQFRLGRREQAIAHFRRAAELQPTMSEAHFNLGGVLRELDRFDEAIAALEQAIAQSPNYVEARNNLAHTLLRAGRLKQGFEAYEWRRHMPTLKRVRPFTQPMWEGEDLTGRTILVWGEQGVGDELLFANMLPDVVRRAKKCLIECDPRLVPMFERSFPTAVTVGRADPPDPRALSPDIDVQCPMGSLARHLRPRLESFPASSGYLAVDHERRGQWRARLDALGPGLKVGICWRSKLITDQRRPWLMELSDLAPVLRVPGAVFVNLQYDECREEIEDARRRFGVTIHQMPGIDLMQEIDNAAALSAAADVIVSAWVSVATTAGALGLPAWTFGLTDEWSMLGTDHCPFQPSLRLFCRRPWEPWDGVVERLRAELTARVAGRT